MAQTPAPAGSNQGGLSYAVAAYGIWGFVPLFFKLVVSVPPVEVLAQRIIWSLPLCFIIMVFRRQIGEYLVALKDWRTLRLLLASALMIAVNRAEEGRVGNECVSTYRSRGWTDN